MPRIRTLKPEFWDSPSTARADLAVRLAFMAMWNWADDSGHGTANLKELEAFAFPNDNVTELPRRSRGNSAGSAGGWRNFAEVCGEVAEAYGVVFYRVGGRPYYEIPNFKRHQSKDYRATSKFPLAEEGEIFDVTSGNGISSSGGEAATTGVSAATAGNSAGSAGDLGPGKGEQGNRGAGEEETCAAPQREADPPGFDEFWEAYPQRRARRKAVAAFRKALNRADAEAIIEGARRYAADPNRADGYTKYAEGWLNGDMWLDPPLPPRRGSASARATSTDRANEVLGLTLELLNEHHDNPKELTR